MSLTIKQIINDAEKSLKTKKILTPQLDAEIILAFLLGKTREYLLAHLEKKIAPTIAKKYLKLADLRGKGEPVAYLIGHKEFFGLSFLVNKNTLIPRPETEILVEEALKIIENKKNKILCVDIGTGSGNIIISLAKKTRNKKEEFIGLDLSAKALKIAKINARLNKVIEKIKFFKSDLLKKVFENYPLLIGYNSIVLIANLPYVPSENLKKLNSPETAGLKFEPKLALNGGLDGLNFYRKLASQIKKALKNNKNIILLCEINFDQGKEIKKIFSFFKKAEIKKDLSGLDRVFIGKI